MGDRVLSVMSGDHCLMWGIGDQVLWVLRGDHYLRKQAIGVVGGEGSDRCLI
ncbi:MAG: hypothetical protein IM580_12155 [Pseudanabaena sp. M090S1SP2A07QC]|jgi:hypothetical protein|nr:hypothetical protein [Pseudanabaena sp. M090S1SP2A07QC]MCA6605122.1 hypothetical protein [Pseudanabaena sp. M007S1SP1A06QC]